MGTDPTHISACEPGRPSGRRPARPTTPSSVRRTAAARARLTSVPPRLVKTCSMTSAASGSSPGSTRSRLDTSVTGTPSSLYPLANSAPVTPEPTTTRCSGGSVEVVDVAPGQDALAVGHRGGQRARRAAGGEQHDVGLDRLDAPRRRRPPPRRGARARGWSAAKRPAPRDQRRRPRAPAASAMSSDCWRASALIRPLTAARSTDVSAPAAGAEPDPRRVAQRGDPVAGGDQRLARHAVGEHAGPAEPVAVDHGDLGAELRGDQRRLVTRPARRR